MNQLYTYTSQKIFLFFCFFIFVAFSFNACKTPPVPDNKLPPVTTNNTNKDTTKTDVVVTDPVVVPPKVDTLRWCDTLKQNETTMVVVCFEKIGKGAIKADTVDYLQILTDEPIVDVTTLLDSTVIKKSSYKVAIILPFMSQRFNPGASSELPSSALKAVEFYEGLQIALDSLEKEGVKLFVDVFDSMRDTNVVKKILEKPALLEADMIVGPVRTSTLELVAAFAKENKKILVSPLNPRSDIAVNNPYYIQLNPSFDVHSQHIIKNMNKITQTDRYRQLDKNIFIIAMKSDSVRVEQLQKDFAVYSNDTAAVMTKYLSSNSSIKINFINPLMDRSKLNIILIPSTDEGFVYNCLREIQSLVDKVEPQKGFQIAVVGMDRWKYYSRITFEYYESLNLHLTSEYHVGKNLSKNIQFRNGYKNNYGIAPREFGYIGFDAMLYFGRMLKKYGVNFQAHLWKENLEMRHTKFVLQPNIESTVPLDGRQDAPAPQIRGFENKFLHFLRFQEYSLQPTNYK